MSRPKIGLDARKARDFGIGSYTRGLIAALAEDSAARGFDFVLFVRPADRELFASLPENFSLIEEDSAGYSVAELTFFAAKIRRSRLDLFHALHYVLPFRIGVPSVVTIHDLIHLLFPGHLEGPVQRFYSRTMLRRAVSSSRRVIAVSETTRSDIVAQLGARPEKVTVIHNGVSKRFQPEIPPEEISAAAAKYGIPADYILYLGGAKPHKNVATAMRAFARAREMGLDPRRILVLAGPMPADEGRVRRLAGSLRLGVAVRIPGLIDEKDLPALFAGARFFLYPTLYEGFGLPVAEAMASGVPVISSATPAIEEIARGCARLFDPMDAEAIATEIVRLDSDRAERARMSQQGLARAGDFTWKQAAEKTVAVYREALGL